MSSQWITYAWPLARKQKQYDNRKKKLTDKDEDITALLSSVNVEGRDEAGEVW